MDPYVEKVLKLPTKQKIILLVVVLALLVVGFFFGLQQPKMKQLNVLKDELKTLRGQVDETRKIADNLPKYKSDYANLQQELEKALTELPNQKEIPSLLTSITSIGKGAGLDFLVFRPKPEEPRDFYAVVPVDITVAGTYHNVGAFFSGVANLPRIVNISNVVFSDVKTDKGRTAAKITCLATTFRFLDKKEIKDEKKEKK